MSKLPPKHSSAFSLIEILLVVSLMSIIVFGLYTMFNQTQLALRRNNTQVDVLASGRAALDVLTREIEQAVASGLASPNPLFAHMYARIDYPNTLKQPLPDSSVRTNVLQELFFLSRPNNQWVINGFFIDNATNMPNGPLLTTNWVQQVGVGTMYRFSIANQPPYQLYPTNLTTWINVFTNARTSYLYDAKAFPYQQVAFPFVDGVVHFRLRPYDSSGVLMTNNTIINLDGTRGVDPRYWIFNEPASTALGAQQFYFQSNAMPAYLDLELGVLEPEVFDKLKAIPTVTAQRSFLERQVAAVHLFHKLIYLQNAQP